MTTSNRKYLKNGGFTLTEILIVLAVVGILTAILLPVLGRVRENGRKVACASNLQQLGLAFQAYQADWNRRFPGGAQKQIWADGGHWVKGDQNYGSTLATASDPALTTDDYPYTYQDGRKALVEEGALYTYVKNKQVYICPSAPDGRLKNLSYSMNCAIAGMSNTRVRQPSEIILLVDESTLNDGYFYTGAGSTDHLTQIHNGGGNLLFIDGHVKFFPFEKYPIGDSASTAAPTYEADSLALKQSLTGTPRFYDAAFNRTTPTKGYYESPVFGSCAAPDPTP